MAGVRLSPGLGHRGSSVPASNGAVLPGALLPDMPVETVADVGSAVDEACFES